MKNTKLSRMSHGAVQEAVGAGEVTHQESHDTLEAAARAANLAQPLRPQGHQAGERPEPHALRAVLPDHARRRDALSAK